MVHVTFSYPSDDSDVTLHVKGYDPGIFSVESTSVQLDSSGNGTLVIQGVSVGSTQITVEDAIGGEDTAGVDVVPPGVISTGSETQGVQYNSNDMPGFTFSLGELSLTPVTIDYNTLGSTLPSSLMGNLLADSVTVEPGSNSVFVPFTVPDDGNIAPTRYAVVKLVVPGDTQPASKQMAVTNTDEPTIKMNDASDNAVIPLDPQGDKNKLTTISLDASKHDGTIVSWTLTWNPNDFLMWTTDEIGIAGTDDLESLGYPNIHGYGSSFDPYSGRVSFTGEGAPPSKLYGQDLDGSSNWDTTSVQLSVEVEKAATAAVPLAVGSAYNTANGTANGAEIYWNGKAVTGMLAGDMLIGQGTSLSVQWLGPQPNIGLSTFNWVAPGVIAGYTESGAAPQPFVPLAYQASSSVNFYWAPQGGNGNDVGETVSCNGEINGNNFSLNTNFDIWTPNWSLQVKTKGKIVINTNLATVEDTATGGRLGVKYNGTVSSPSGISDAGANWGFVQLITPNATITENDNTKWAQWHTGVQGLDGTSYWYGFDSNDNAYGQSEVPVNGTTHETGDGPQRDLGHDYSGQNNTGITPNSAAGWYSIWRLFVMYDPPGNDKIVVPLAVAVWSVNASFTWDEANTKWQMNGPGLVVNPGSPTTIFPEYNYSVKPTDFRQI